MLDSLETIAFEVDFTDFVVQMKQCNTEVMGDSGSCTSKPLIFFELMKFRAVTQFLPV